MKSTKKILIILYILCSTSALYAQNQPDGYNLVWADEFESATINLDDWSYRETQRENISICLPQNVSIEDGKMKIDLRIEDHNGIPLTCGGLISKKTFKYGYFESAIKVDGGKGWHEAFWTSFWSGVDYLPMDSVTNSRSEIDVLEHYSGHDEQEFSYGIIEWWEGGHKGIYRKNPQVDVDLTSDFHIWAFEFTPDYFNFFFDGEIFATINSNKIPKNDFYVWLTAIGTAMADSNGACLFDYFRYYEIDFNSAEYIQRKNQFISKFINEAIMQGTYANPEDSVEIRVDLFGVAPWEIVYTDGTNEYSVSDIKKIKYTFNVYPEETTEYSLISVKGGNDEEGYVSGGATVVYGERFIEPIFDGMVRQYWKDGVWDDDFISIKHDPEWSRDAFLTFNLEGESAVNMAILRMHCFDWDVSGEVEYKIRYIARTYDSTLTWLNKPSATALRIAVNSSTKGESLLNSYFDWDITDTYNMLIDQEVENITFIIDAVEGVPALAKFHSSEALNNLGPHILFDDNVTRVADDDLSFTKRTLHLEQNYPNPFNPVTMLVYEIPSTLQVELTIYNVLGMEVKQLVNERQNAGRYAYIFDAANLPGGVYLYQLKTGNSVKTKKMILLR